MKKLPLIGIAAAIAALAIALSHGWLSETPVNFADPSEPDLVASGERVYQEHCASCHGTNLEGELNWRTPLEDGSLRAPPHDETGHTWHHPDEMLFQITKHGGQSVAPADFKSNMPAFADSLSDRDISGVLAFIKSRWPQEIQNRQAAMNARPQ